MLIQPIILAAGKGTRMGGSIPKALTPYKGSPMVHHVLTAVTKVLPTVSPLVVIGHQGKLVKESLSTKNCFFVEQQEQRGTGHAVACALPFVQQKISHIIVLYADQPRLATDTIKNLVDTHRTSGATLTLGTVLVPDFNEWRSCFNRFGRIIRDVDHRITGITEWKDASETERAITEVNPSYFCFEKTWLLEAIKTLSASHNAAHEYYLTDMVSRALTDGKMIATVPIPPHEALGINTPEELALAESLT